MGGLAALAREGGTQGHRLRRQRLSADVRPTARARHRSGRRLRRRTTVLQPDLYVIGNVVTRGNALVEAILDAGVPLHERPAMAGRACAAGPPCAGGGGHARQDDDDVDARLGARARRPAARLSGRRRADEFRRFGAARADHRAFVIEADEYDTAFFDKRSKFVHYRPRTAILNNLEFDHADIFDDLAAIERQFHHLVRTMPASGRVVVNAREESLQRVLAQGMLERSGALRCAQGGAGRVARARRAARLRRAARQLEDRARRVVAARRTQPAQRAGRDRRGRARRRRARESRRRRCRAFQNVRRRLELRGTVRVGRGDVKVYDDFAHHPTAMRTTINGLRRKVGASRILAVFEPRSNTMKLGVDEGLAAVVARRGRLGVLPLAAGSTGTRRRRSRRSVRRHRCATASTSSCKLSSRRRSAGDHVLCMSNGGFGGIHGKLLEALARHPDAAPARRP